MSRLAALLVSAVLLSACGTGLQAHTYSQTGRQDGVSQDLETVLVRNLQVQPAPTDDPEFPQDIAGVTGALVNTGDRADSLVSVTSPIATDVVLVQGDQQVESISIPAGGTAGEWFAVLEGLSEPLKSATYVDVTLEFTNGGRTTLSVPVQLNVPDLEDREVHQEPYGH